MNTIYIKQGEEYELGGQVATIGFFDGVHRGHQFLIRRVIDEAERVGMASAVITFDQHPRQVLQTDYQPELLSTLDEKLLLLSKTHIDNAFVLHFDAALASLSAYDFMQEVLCKQLNVKKLVIGYDNRFGHNRSERFEDYVQYGKALGIEVIGADPFLPDDEKVSSSIIRNYLREGEIEAANRLLGYHYSIESRIVSGYQNGRKMGFPGNLYGQELLVSFISKIRDEHKFDSLEALSEQLKQDKDHINRLFDEAYKIEENIINKQ